MTVQDVKKTLGKSVRYSNARLFIDAEYIFNAYILRLVNGKPVHQAELLDVYQNSIVIVPLEEVEINDKTGVGAGRE